MKKNLIILTTGGSGGHVFPAEALATCLKKGKYELAFVTDTRGLKRIKGTLASIDNYSVCASSVSGRSFLGKIWALGKLAFGTLQAVRLLLKKRPRLVIGFGGYASIPTVLAAQFLHIPVILHEQNAILGKANRLLSRRTKLIATSFTPTGQIPSSAKVAQTGMPVRPQFGGCWSLR